MVGQYVGLLHSWVGTCICGCLVLIKWLFNCLVNTLIAKFIGCLKGFVDLLGGCLINLLVTWVVGEYFICEVGWLHSWLVGCLVV